MFCTMLLRSIACGFLLLVGVAPISAAEQGQPTPTQTPMPAPPVPTYILRGSPDSAQRCGPVTPQITRLLIRVMTLNLSSKKTHVTLLRQPMSIDPIGDLAASIVNPKQPPINAIVANVCPRQDVIQATVNGYTIAWDDDLEHAGVSGGTTVKGTFDALEAADWSGIFPAGKYPGTGYLPVLGDNADIINANVLRNLRNLTVINEAKPLLKLCRATENKLLIAGQNSLATQQLDPFRTTLQAASLTLFTEPQPYQSFYKVGLATLMLGLIPNAEVIPVQIFDCKDPNNVTAFGESTTFADPSKPQRMIVGWSKKAAYGTNVKIQRKTLDLAIADLQNQLDCIISRRLNERDKVPLPDKDTDPVPLGPWCEAYYKNLPRGKVQLGTPATPRITEHGAL